MFPISKKQWQQQPSHCRDTPPFLNNASCYTRLSGSRSKRCECRQSYNHISYSHIGLSEHISYVDREHTHIVDTFGLAGNIDKAVLEVYAVVAGKFSADFRVGTILEARRRKATLLIGAEEMLDFLINTCNIIAVCIGFTEGARRIVTTPPKTDTNHRADSDVQPHTVGRIEFESGTHGQGEIVGSIVRLKPEFLIIGTASHVYAARL